MIKNKKGEVFAIGAGAIFGAVFVGTIIYGVLVGWKPKDELIRKCQEQGNSSSYCEAEFSTVKDRR